MRSDVVRGKARRKLYCEYGESENQSGRSQLKEIVQRSAAQTRPDGADGADGRWRAFPKLERRWRLFDGPRALVFAPTKMTAALIPTAATATATTSMAGAAGASGATGTADMTGTAGQRFFVSSIATTGIK